MSAYQFKIDENLPVEIADLLVQAGYDAKTVNDQLLQGATDSRIIDICKIENRILVTLDTDFSDIRAYPPEDYAGIVVLRVVRQPSRVGSAHRKYFRQTAGTARLQ